jgi:hypothetical protein
MVAAGHKSVASHKRYENMQKSHLKAGFQNSNLFPARSQEKAEEKDSAVSA